MSRINLKLLAILAINLGLFTSIGCGSKGPKTHPVVGKIELETGDVADLAGSNIEAASLADPTIRASAEIQSDGSFKLETLHEGVIKKGAIEGEYRVRIILNDDDPKSRKRAAKAIARRFLEFDTSGLLLAAPSKEAVVLRLSSQ